MRRHGDGPAQSSDRYGSREPPVSLWRCHAWRRLSADAATITLAWDRNPETNIGGYVLYYGTGPGQYTAID